MLCTLMAVSPSQPSTPQWLDLLLEEMNLQTERRSKKLAEWCSEHNILLNTSKTREITIDFKRHKGDTGPLYINRDCVQRVFSFSFKETHNAGLGPE